MILKNYNSFMFIFDMKNNPNIKIFDKNLLAHVSKQRKNMKFHDFEKSSKVLDFCILKHLLSFNDL